MNPVLQFLHNLAREDQILLNEPMVRHTTFRVGGPADIMFFPEHESQVLEAMQMARDHDLPCYVIGNGSNLIVRDGGIRGMVIVLGDKFGSVACTGDMVQAQAGAPMARVAAAAQSAGLTGLEFISGIPGTLGGGCAMNAGAYGGQLSDVLLDARVLLDGEIQTLSQAEMEMGYRTTLPLKRGGIVLAARFALQKGDPEAIAARMKALNARRRDKQPLNFPSAGSVFKRPKGFFAGALIEEAGLKGRTVGGAQVSDKHAGFIINIGGATARDVLQLIGEVQEAVSARFGISLETEVRVIGEE